MLDQEDDIQLEDEWLTADERLTCFIKSRQQVVVRVKGSELLSVQGPQYSEKDLVVRKSLPSSTERPTVIEPGTNGNHAPIGQAQNDNSSANSQEISVSMDNVRPGVTEDQSIISIIGEALGKNFHVRSSERIRISPQQYNPGFQAARDWKNDAAVSIV